jgi:predicted phage terminase large subunit-like protein
MQNQPLTKDEKKALKAHLVLRAKASAVRRHNAYHKDDKPVPALSKEGGMLLNRCTRHHLSLVAKYKAQIKAKNMKGRNERAGKAISKAKSKIDSSRTRLELEKVADAYDVEEASVVERELAQRALARKYLIASVVRFNPDYLAGWVHKDICARLERFMLAVEEGRNPRLMLQMPPRHGKSTLASQEFPAFVLGHHPNWELIVCSYAETLALDFSRAVRERMRDPEFHVLFPLAVLDKENQNAKGWKLSRKGGFLPAGVEGPITGKGAHILIIDDPIKNSQEADSELKRSGIMKWYSSTAYTRLAPGGGVLIIQTRWHLDDLSGRLEAEMAEGNGDVFEVVRYPAVAVVDVAHRTKGETLHEARYTSAQLKMIRKAVGERTWAALYQQNPVPEHGAQFQESMIHYYNPEELPDQLTKVSAWDLAIGQKEVNDKTVGFTWGKDLAGDYWFVDCRHGHFDALELCEEICDSYSKHNPYTVGIEKDKVSMAVGPLLDTLIEDRELYGLHITELRPMMEGNKVKRARSLQGLMRRGKVHIPRPDDADWVEEFVTELLQFPYGRRDDHVDAAAWLALMATDTPTPGLAYSRMPKRTTWRDRLAKMTRRERTSMSA